MTTRKKRPWSLSAAIGESRGRLLAALCERPMTAVELAKIVGTSDNAVRVHLEAMRVAGFVDYRVERRGVGKPTHVYAISETAEYFLSAAYAPALQALLRTLREQAEAEFESLLRASGETLARQVRTGDAVSRGTAAATAAFQELGGSLKATTRGNERIFSSNCCPLAGVVRDAPETCRLMESMLRAASGLEFTERCDRGERPRCVFATPLR